MGGISTSVGLISGIDTGALIQQLLQVEARPRDLAAQRLVQLQTQQAAFLDLNTRLSSLKSAASTFHVNNIFDSAKATSSDEASLTATASTSAQPGSYTFVVDRLVSTQQSLSKGFADQDSSAFGASSFTFESNQARLASDVGLADLNGGSGVRRGSFTITDSSGASATIDLSRTATVGEALDAINGAGIGVSATTVDDRIVLTDSSTGGSALTVTDDAGSFTATDLGITGVAAGNKITGSRIYYATGSTSVGQLNDGTGIATTSTLGTGAFDFTVRVDGTDVKVFLGQTTETTTDPDTGEETTVTTPAASTINDVVTRINDALTETLGGTTTLSASLKADGTGLQIVDSAGTAVIDVLDRGEETGGSAVQTTARDLGIAGSGTGSISGSRIFGGLNSILTKSLNGGQGIGGDGTLSITDRTGVTHTITGLDTLGTLTEVFDAISTQSGGVITASLDELGTGISITDTTTGINKLVIEGTNGADSAASLGISTGPTGVAANTVDSGNLQKRYIAEGTLLSSLNNGSSIGTGSFDIRDATGETKSVSIGSNDRTVGDVINAINSTGLAINARINDNGDGIIIEETNSGTAGSVTLKVTDTSGAIASTLKIEGEATGTDADNFIDGSFETMVNFDPTDTLNDVVTKINDAGVNAIATVVNDGSGSAPYRLSFTARNSGTAGRFILDTNGFDLALTSLSKGDNARAFFGSDDPAKALLVSSNTNTLDGLIQGVSIDLNNSSGEDSVQLTVSRDLDVIEGKIGELVTSFNDLIGRIDVQTRFDSETEQRGPLLGDSLAITLRQRLFNVVQTVGDNVTGQFSRLSEVGITIGDGGKTIDFDSSAFRDAYAQDPQSVAALFDTFDLAPTDTTQDLGNGITVSGNSDDRSFTSIGVVGKLEELARDYLDSVDGILTARDRSLGTQIDLQQKRIDDFNARLLDRQKFLQGQFAAMEKALAGLQSQQSALASLRSAG